MNEITDETYDVVVIGAGAAGLSAAVALARFRRPVLVLDAGDPRNAPASHVHNFLTRDGTPPADLYAAGRAEVTGYGGRIDDSPVRQLRRDDHGFVVELADRAVRARRVLLATGLRDELPDLPGLRERWGRDVLHCPYCHGWEVRDQRIGVLATGPLATHQALLFAQLSPHVTVLAHLAPPDEEQRLQLEARGVTVVPGEVAAVESAADRLTGVRFADGRLLELDALVVAPLFVARAELVEALGLHPVELRSGDHVVARHLEADPTGATAVPGLWVAGNVTNPQAQVVTAAAAGLAAAAAINNDLVTEDTTRAVEARRTARLAGAR